jgi:hypothetical protein
METLWQALGQTTTPNDGGLDSLTAWGGLQPGTHVEKIALFPRLQLATATD